MVLFFQGEMEFFDVAEKLADLIGLSLPADVLQVQGPVGRWMVVNMRAAVHPVEPVAKCFRQPAQLGEAHVMRARHHFQEQLALVHTFTSTVMLVSQPKTSTTFTQVARTPTAFHLPAQGWRDAGAPTLGFPEKRPPTPTGLHPPSRYPAPAPAAVASGFRLPSVPPGKAPPATPTVLPMRRVGLMPAQPEKRAVKHFAATKGGIPTPACEYARPGLGAKKGVAHVHPFLFHLLSTAMKLQQVTKIAHCLSSPYRVTRGGKFRLRDFDPQDTGELKSADKPHAQEALQAGVEALSELQDVLYAQDRWSVLLIFQAMDAAGKDGTIKHVMSGVNPQGCQVSSFKAPTNEDLDHDYLWRCVKQLPERGRIGIFNRSYYEETLVVRVHPEFLAGQKLPAPLVTKRIWTERFQDIRAFERYLARNGTIVRKFFRDQLIKKPRPLHRNAGRVRRTSAAARHFRRGAPDRGRSRGR